MTTCESTGSQSHAPSSGPNGTLFQKQLGMVGPLGGYMVEKMDMEIQLCKSGGKIL